MRRIYDGQVGQIVPSKMGVVFAIGEKTFGGQFAVTYRFYSFDTARVTLVDRSAYLIAKFGPDYNKFISLINDHINCHIAHLDDGKMLIVACDANAMIIDKNGKVFWKGDLKYKDSLPLDVVYDGEYVFVSYPDIDCIVKYNSKNMHMVMRAGSVGDNAFSNPCGLSLLDGLLTVCCSTGNEIKLFDSNNFSLKTYAKLNEPVYRYYKEGVNEIVLLESGVYIF